MDPFARRCGILAVAALPAIATAQSATIVVTHDDLDGIVDPGQTVKITYHVSWTEWGYLGSMAGDAIVTPNRGTASNPATGFWWGASNSWSSPGSPDGGSVLGYLARYHPTLGSVGGFGFVAGGLDALTYDWIAPGPEDAGLYEFTFAFDPEYPSIGLYPSAGSSWFEPVPTTVLGASLTVTPTPGTLAALGGVAGLGGVRRRRV